MITVASIVFSPAEASILLSATGKLSSSLAWPKCEQSAHALRSSGGLRVKAGKCSKSGDSEFCLLLTFLVGLELYSSGPVARGLPEMQFKRDSNKARSKERRRVTTNCPRKLQLSNLREPW